MTPESIEYMAKLIVIHPDVDSKLLARVFESGYSRGKVEGLDMGQRIYNPKVEAVCAS